MWLVWYKTVENTLYKAKECIKKHISIDLLYRIIFMLKKYVLFLLIFSGISILFLIFYSIFYEPRSLQVREFTLLCSNWKTRPIKMAILSDVHVGGMHTGLRQVYSIREHIQKLKPDLVVHLGDYINGHEPAEEKSSKTKKILEQSLYQIMHIDVPLGVYAVLGNHDQWYSRHRLVKLLKLSGVHILENAAVFVQTESASSGAEKRGFWLVGVEDYATAYPDWKKALMDVDFPSFSIGLSHSPDTFPNMPNSLSLGLAGHTHGGQVNLPFLGRRVTSSQYGKRYAYGFVREGKQLFYISSGVGTSILPVRFRSSPEIVLMHIRRAEQTDKQDKEPFCKRQ